MNIVLINCNKPVDMVLQFYLFIHIQLQSDDTLREIHVHEK